MTKAPQIRKSISKEILRDMPLPPTKEPEISCKESALKAKPRGIWQPLGLAREARMHAFFNGMSFSKFVRRLLLRELKSSQSL
jgi:hypothetical protein